MNNIVFFPHIYIEPTLPSDLKKEIGHLLNELQLNRFDQEIDRNTICFLSEESAQKLINKKTFLKICFQDLNQSLFHQQVDLDKLDLDLILDQASPLSFLKDVIRERLEFESLNFWDELYDVGLKNLSKFKSLVSSTMFKLMDHQFEIGSVLNGLVELEKELFNLENMDKSDRSVRAFIKGIQSKIKFRIIDKEKIQDLKNPFDFLPVSSNFGIEIDWRNLASKELIEIYLILNSLNQVIRYRSQSKDSFFDERIWDKILDSLPFPIALFNHEGEVKQCNHLFSKMNTSPEEFKGIYHQQKILIGEIPYTVFVKETIHMGEKKILRVFFTESFFIRNDEHYTPSSQELGIISSSIAHELNNPIAGIHSAVALLQLDPKEDMELNQILDEMKSGALRCKQLIETFLGFSRARISTTSKISDEGSMVELCFQQALNLLRFRTVESGIRFKYNFIRYAHLRNQSNLSLMTMIFYLCLGEMMTLFSHQQLISNKMSGDKNIEIELVESSQEICLQFKDLNISNLKISKLIFNLMNIENMSLSVSDYSIRLILNSVKDNE